jgi:hypothetical protein
MLHRRGASTEASNTEIFTDLLQGFSTKFGKPDAYTTEPVRTRIGVEYERRMAAWTDMHGNHLVIVSLFNSIDRGLLRLQSAEQREKQAAESAAKEAKKRFQQEADR